MNMFDHRMTEFRMAYQTGLGGRFGATPADVMIEKGGDHDLPRSM